MQKRFAGNAERMIFLAFPTDKGKTGMHFPTDRGKRNSFPTDGQRDKDFFFQRAERGNAFSE